MRLECRCFLSKTWYLLVFFTHANLVLYSSMYSHHMSEPSCGKSAKRKRGELLITVMCSSPPTTIPILKSIPVQDFFPGYRNRFVIPYYRIKTPILV